MIDTLTNSVETLYALYHKDIVSFFADHLADRETSWDLCHGVFLRLLLTLASDTNLKHPQRWLMRVAKNLLIDTYRHQQTARAANLPLHSHEVAMLASDATTFRTLLEREDMLQIIVETFQTLPEKYQRPGQAHGGNTARKYDVDQKPAGAPPERDSQRLRRVLTLREAVALSIGGTIGGGIFVLVGAAAGRAGPGAI